MVIGTPGAPFFSSSSFFATSLVSTATFEGSPKNESAIWKALRNGTEVVCSSVTPPARVRTFSHISLGIPVLCLAQTDMSLFWVVLGRLD